ncbi:MAG: RluA family pseudouridine synthase [Actinomycetota bacterium]|nr:RluA family pseudouridine synthase [Actinomycetota bacterium]
MRERSPAMNPEKFVATPGRLDAVVATLTGTPRADVQRAIAAGHVTVDGVQRTKSHRLAGGERLVVSVVGELAVPPEGPPVPIRFEDDYLLVVAKPAGLVTHPTTSRRTGTLVNRLLGMEVPLSTLGGPIRPGIVHRLDVGTSGLMIVAKTDDAHRALASALKRHAIERRYLALVRGAVEHDVFTVDAPLGRRAARIIVDQTDGRHAETAFEVVERLPRSTLLEVAPRTGRTHQIRVHLAAIGHPILGDRAYGGAGDDAKRVGLERAFLHSWKLSFEHPMTAEPCAFEEPLPEELAAALAIARRDGAGPNRDHLRP